MLEKNLRTAVDSEGMSMDQIKSALPVTCRSIGSMSGFTQGSIYSPLGGSRIADKG